MKYPNIFTAKQNSIDSNHEYRWKPWSPDVIVAGCFKRCTHCTHDSTDDSWKLKTANIDLQLSPKTASYTGVEKMVQCSSTENK